MSLSENLWKNEGEDYQYYYPAEIKKSFKDAEKFCKGKSMDLFRLEERMIRQERVMETFNNDRFPAAFSGVIAIADERYDHGNFGGCKCVVNSHFRQSFFSHLVLPLLLSR